MPYPAQINTEAIIEMAWVMTEQDGFEGLSLSALAKALGVKAPSLYRHVPNKAHLLRGINELTLTRLFSQVEAATQQATPPHAGLIAVGHAFRDFAHQHPTLYTLAFSTLDADSRPDAAHLVSLALPWQALIGRIVGEAEALTALRGLFALTHGFVMLEINDQLQRGGDLEAAFAQSLEAYLRGWA